MKAEPAVAIALRPGSDLSNASGPSPARTNKYEGGNLVDDGTRTFVYDARGRMIQTTWGSVVTDYVVNGLGQRVRKTVNSGPLAGTTYCRTGMSAFVVSWEPSTTRFTGASPVSGFRGRPGLASSAGSRDELAR